MVNGDKAAFANVIAPFMLMQAEWKIKSRKSVNMQAESNKCMLLKSCDGDRLLRGLVEQWRGKLDANVGMIEHANSYLQIVVVLPVLSPSDLSESSAYGVCYDC